MKIKYIIIIVMLLILIITLLIITNKKRNNNNISISTIKHLSFSYTTGYAINARVRYEIDYKNNEYNTIITPNGISEEDKLEITVNEKVINKIIEVLEKYDVYKWNGFDKVDKNVLDGNSFNLYLKMQNDDTIEASGYMKWPENYGKVRDELDNIFMDIYNKKFNNKY